MNYMKRDLPDKRNGGRKTLDNRDIYRVVKAHRDRFLVRNEEKELYCVLTGAARFRESCPVVGDEVEIIENPYGDSLIREILPRRTVFCRPDRSGHGDAFVKTLRTQPLVANMDCVFIITSLNHDFSPNRIARYAAVTLSGGAKPVAVLTKADLCPDPEEMEKKVTSLCTGLEAVAVSALTGYGLERLRRYCLPGTVIALLGSSGAGKSTLVNTLAGREVMAAGAIREEDSKGRHTTTHREMIEADGAFFIDTPGLREIGVMDAEEGIAGTFSDIEELTKRCAFSNCGHRSEPGCAVLEALGSGELDPGRWETYLRLKKENSWSKQKKNEMMMNIAMHRRSINKTGRK